MNKWRMTHGIFQGFDTSERLMTDRRWPHGQSKATICKLLSEFVRASELYFGI